MVTKEDIIKEYKKLQKQNIELKKNNDFLFKQQKEFKAHAEKAGSDCAKIEQQLIKLTEKYNRLKSQMEFKK